MNLPGNPHLPPGCSSAETEINPPGWCDCGTMLDRDGDCPACAARDPQDGEDFPEAVMVSKNAKNAATGSQDARRGISESPDLFKYRQLHAEMQKLVQAFGPLAMDTQEFQACWKESEAIKNRNGGMPPTEPAAKCENCGSPATHTGEFSEGNESGGCVPVCWRCAVTHRCHNVRPISPKE